MVRRAKVTPKRIDGWRPGRAPAAACQAYVNILLTIQGLAERLADLYQLLVAAR